MAGRWRAGLIGAQIDRHSDQKNASTLRQQCISMALIGKLPILLIHPPVIPDNCPLAVVRCVCVCMYVCVCVCHCGNDPKVKSITMNYDNSVVWLSINFNL